MTTQNGVLGNELPSDLEWRTCGDGVELALLPNGHTAIRHSQFPEGPALIFTPAEMDAFIKGANDGDFDDMLA